MKRYIFISILTLALAFDSFAQNRMDCNTEELQEKLQGVWRQTEGDALAIVDNNAYFLYGTDQGALQDTHGELFSIVKNNNGESYFIWWSDMIVQEFVLEKDAEGNVIGQYARVYFGRAVSVCDPYILLTNPALDVSKSQAIKITMRNLGPANKLSFYWVGKWKDGTWIDGKENVSFNEEHAYHFTSGYKKNQSETSTWTTYTIPVCESLYNGVSTWGAAGKITALRIQSTASDDKTTEKNILQIKSIEGISRPEYSTEDDTTDIKNKCKNDSQSEIDQAIEEQKNNPINGFIFPRDNDEISSEDLNKEDGKNLKLFKHKDGTLFSTARTNGAYTFSLTPKQGHDVKLSENNQYFTNLNINYINYSYVKEMNLTVKYSLNGQTRDYITSVPLTPQMDGTSAQTANINLFQKGFDGELVSLTFRIIPIGNDNLIEFKQISFDVYQPNIIPGIDFVDILCGSFDQKNNVETSFDFQQFKTKVHVTSSNEPYMSKNIPSYDLLGYESFTLNYDYKGESTNGKIKLKFGLEDSSSKEFEIGINKGANSTTQAFAWSGCSVIKSIKLEYLGIEEIYLEKLTYNLPISSINLSNKGYVSSVKGRNTNFDFDANHSAYKRTLPELARLRFYGFDKAKSDGHIIDNLSLKGKHSLVITYSCEIPFTSESDSKIFTFLYGGTSTDDPNYKNSANEPGGIIPGTGRSGSLDSPSPFKPKSYAGMEPNSWATFKIDFNEALTGEELECFITVWAFEFNTKKEGNFYVRAMSII